MLSIKKKCLSNHSNKTKNNSFITLELPNVETENVRVNWKLTITYKTSKYKNGCSKKAWIGVSTIENQLITL